MPHELISDNGWEPRPLQLDPPRWAPTQNLPGPRRPVPRGRDFLAENGEGICTSGFFLAIFTAMCLAAADWSVGMAVTTLLTSVVMARVMVWVNLDVPLFSRHVYSPAGDSGVAPESRQDSQMPAFAMRSLLTMFGLGVLALTYAHSSEPTILGYAATLLLSAPFLHVLAAIFAPDEDGAFRTFLADIRTVPAQND